MAPQLVPMPPHLSPMMTWQVCFVIPPEGTTISHPVGPSNPGGTREWTRSNALLRCKQRCAQLRGSQCQGVQVVPLVPPPGVIFNRSGESVGASPTNSWLDLDHDQNIPWGRKDCVARGSRCLLNQPPGSMVCYRGAHTACPARLCHQCSVSTDVAPLSTPQVCYPIEFNSYPPSEIAERWQVVTDDPTDEVYYSTIYLRTENWRFDGPRLADSCGDACAPTTSTEVAWRVGDRCLSCESANANHQHTGDPNVLPDWTLAQTCTLCNRQQMPGMSMPPPPPPVVLPPPPPPPIGVTTVPSPPAAAPDCVEGGLDTSTSGYSCAMQLGSLELHYSLSETSLSGRLHCFSDSLHCGSAGWIALGFAATPGAMVGATAPGARFLQTS